MHRQTFLFSNHMAVVSLQSVRGNALSTSHRPNTQQQENPHADTTSSHGYQCPNSSWEQSEANTYTFMERFLTNIMTTSAYRLTRLCSESKCHSFGITDRNTQQKQHLQAETTSRHGYQCPDSSG
jgi:hypothetical protein